MHRYFVSGIGTDVGKTIVSAILVELLQAIYWKPVQAGDLENSDSLKIKKLTSGTIHPERYRLNTPASPHLAAQIDGIEMQLNDFKLPETEENLIIEGAGGLLVPLNNKGDLYIDLIQKFQLPVILVSRHYLGSINHTLLSAEALTRRNISVKGIIFVGDENEATETIIQQKTGFDSIGRIPLLTEVNPETIKNAGKTLRL